MQSKIIRFQQHGDDRGQLVAIEESIDVPFEIKRVYFMYDTKINVRRGFHAHKELKQILFCVKGSCKIHLDDGHETREILLDKPYYGLLIEGNVWREMYDFSPDAVLMVLADHHYDEKDYIRNYVEFRKYIKENGYKENL